MSRILGARHLIERGANIFTLLHRPQVDLHGSAARTEYHVGCPCGDLRGSQVARLCSRPTATHTAPWRWRWREDMFYHIIAVLWSPAYRHENEAALRQDWPRVPIPAERGLLAESAGLGRTVADLLLPDRPVRGVTCGTIRPELRALGVPSKVGGGNIDPGADLKVEATWGFFGAKNAVMCGKGKTVPGTADPDGRSGRLHQRSRLLAGRAAGRVDDDHRRLSGGQEMAQLPRVPRAGPPLAAGGDDLHHRGHPPPEGPAPARRRAGRELSCRGRTGDGKQVLERLDPTSLAEVVNEIGGYGVQSASTPDPISRASACGSGW